MFTAGVRRVWHNRIDASVRMNRNKTKDLMCQRKGIGRWITIGLGVAVGLTGCFVTFFTEWIVHARTAVRLAPKRLRVKYTIKYFMAVLIARQHTRKKLATCKYSPGMADTLASGPWPMA